MITAQYFTFDNQAQHMAGFAAQLHSCLVPLLAGYPQSSRLQLKARYIIAEFLNNAVKHSGTDESILGIGQQDGYLLITKSDSGKLWNELTSIMATQGVPVLLSADDLNELYATNEGAHVRFYCRAAAASALNTHTLLEHMGLLIIANAADEFIYEYREPFNVFTAKLLLS
jgi:hypothetical protein